MKGERCWWGESGVLVALEKETAPSLETAASSRPTCPEGVKNECLQVRCWAPIRPISGL